MGKIYRQNKGFSIPEAVISVLIIALVWIAMFNAFIIGRANASIARHRMQAMYVAEGYIERLRKLPFASIAGGVSTVIIDGKATPYTYSDDFNGTQTVTVYNDSTYYKRVVVDVSWNERIAGKNKTMHEYCGTLIANDTQAN